MKHTTIATTNIAILFIVVFQVSGLNLNSAQASVVRPMIRRSPGLDSEGCAKAVEFLMPVGASIPTTPAELPGALAAADITITDPCNIPTDLPPEVAEPLSSYTETVQSWYSKHEVIIVSALEACPDLTSYLSNMPICTDSILAEEGSFAQAKTATGTVEESEVAQTGALDEENEDGGEDGNSNGDGVVAGVVDEGGSDGESAAYTNTPFVVASVVFLGFWVGVLAL